MSRGPGRADRLSRLSRLGRLGRLGGGVLAVTFVLSGCVSETAETGKVPERTTGATPPPQIAGEAARYRAMAGQQATSGRPTGRPEPAEKPQPAAGP
ncbi:MAG: hypothetical protein SFU56_20975 [Capsulimonadales bacterium]|nr:hypothetical protein [Capsulimonadales bacterium]